MSWARAASSSFLILGTVAPQRGRAPQFVFMRSRIRSAVVFGSIIAGFSSGTGGGFTVVHSVVMSFACEDGAASAVITAASAAARHDGQMRCFMMLLLICAYNGRGSSGSETRQPSADFAASLASGQRGSRRSDF